MQRMIVAIACASLLLIPGCDAAQPGPKEAGAASASHAKAKARAALKKKRQALRIQAQRRAARIRAARAERRRLARRQALQEAARLAAAEEARQEAQAEAEAAASACHESYVGNCLDPSRSDYDCAGGSGDGPGYTGPVQVVGYDEYDLDRDGDGYACE